MSNQLSVEFLNGSVEMTVDEARQILAVVACDPFSLLCEKFFLEIEKEVVDGLRTGTFIAENSHDIITDQARVQLVYEISQLKDRLTEQISLADLQK